MCKWKMYGTKGRPQHLIQRPYLYSKASICRTAREEFEYASGEPDENHLTVLRVLSFTDEFVKRALINAAKIEKTILVEHRTIGDPIMTLPPHHRRNIDRCYTKDGYSIGGMTGGGNVMALTLYRGAPRIAPDRSDYIACVHFAISSRYFRYHSTQPVDPTFAESTGSVHMKNKNVKLAHINISLKSTIFVLPSTLQKRDFFNSR